MIRNKLSILLAERGLKITKVANDTNISRNSITSIAQNNSKMIQLDTINTLCKYLKITPGDFFEYNPLDIEVKVSFDNEDEYDPKCQQEHLKRPEQFDIFLNITNEFSYTKSFSYTGKLLNEYHPMEEDDIETVKMLTKNDLKGHTLGDVVIKLDVKEDKEDAIKLLNNLSQSFITDLEEKIINAIIDKLPFTVFYTFKVDLYGTQGY